MPSFPSFTKGAGGGSLCGRRVGRVRQPREGRAPAYRGQGSVLLRSGCQSFRHTRRGEDAQARGVLRLSSGRSPTGLGVNRTLSLGRESKMAVPPKAEQENAAVEERCFALLPATSAGAGIMTAPLGNMATGAMDVVVNLRKSGEKALPSKTEGGAPAEKADPSLRVGMTNKIYGRRETKEMSNASGSPVRQDDREGRKARF